MKVTISAKECSTRAFKGICDMLAADEIEFKIDSHQIQFEAENFHMTLEDGTTCPYRENNIWFGMGGGKKTNHEMVLLLRSKGLTIWPRALPNKKKQNQIQRLADLFSSLDAKSQQEFLNLTGLIRPHPSD